MKEHLIMHHYSLWLEKFCKSKPPKKSYQQAKLIIQDLPKMNDIAALIDLIENHLPSEHHDFQQEEKPTYEPINFYCQLMNWRNDLLARKTQFELAMQTLQQTAMSPKISPLIDLLTEMLQAPQAILYHDLTSILHCICDPSFSMVLKFIEQQHEAPQPVNPPRGSFAAAKPLNDNHRHCLALLNNIADSYPVNSHNRLWEKANGLLQNALRLYVDITFFEIDLNEGVTPEKPHQWCTIV
ncbi:hypothetical protein [Legionella waltersii]|uniref:Uncharacterized protein n=1 Tax=Legionella waltersii TaxID=66969 RepID=A0A0W1AGN7_9GAMM|nr:hypothetical protein [Legionella waltersii]KTD80522.1 hypothetical protein Lwal_1221 [Legionella waltersii]SNV09471.1 Uncharacterised protein [Legionella waltersii]